jgi:excisionase family DNA binding protein
MSRKPAELQKMLSVEELAEILQVPEDTIYYWRSQGAGPRGIKVGRYVRFRQSDVEAWLATREDKA